MPDTTKRVLVFDDDEDLLTIFRFFFEEQGWEVHTRETCDDIIAQTEEIGPDLILMDNWIPVMGGLAATQLIKKDSVLKTIPVIFVSANNDVKALAAKAGADAYMAKPFDFDVLSKLVDTLTNKF